MSVYLNNIVLRPGRLALVIVLTQTLALACGRLPGTAESSPAATSAPPPSVASIPPTASPTLAPTAPPQTAAPTTAPAPSPVRTPAPTRPPATGSAPYCAIGDVLTPIRSYAEHARTFLDHTYMLPPEYDPVDLVFASRAGFTGESGQVVLRQILMADLAAFRFAALSAGHRLELLSGYRTFEEQAETFAYWVRVGGYEQALRTSARAGHSEHQLGTTIDVSSSRTPPWSVPDWGATPTGRWVATHAWEYGFLMSYPAGKERVTCYDYEPWHYRWVGRDVSARVRSSGLTLREFQAR
jgi:D-alanyl-D-alanine carboxypeptidase